MLRIMQRMQPLLLLIPLLLALLAKRVSALQLPTTTAKLSVRKTTVSTAVSMSTVAPPRRKTRRRTRTTPAPQKPENPLEYLMDEDALRGDEDPFHILLLGETFAQPRITVTYVTGQLCYTLDMPERDALEHAQFASEQGLSCLGTWKRKECLELGEKLQLRDIRCRVVPGADGGGRPWQARNANGGPGDPSLPSS